MVVNPRAANDFAKATLRRSKTDSVDADILLEFVRRMAFVSWKPPATELLQLRSVSRRISALTRMLVQEKQRLHAARRSQVLAPVLEEDIRSHMLHLKGHIRALRAQAVEIIRAHPPVRRVPSSTRSVAVATKHRRDRGTREHGWLP